MLIDINAYDLKMLNSLAIENIDEQQISQELEHYLDKYSDCFIRSQQIKYFKAAIQGLRSGLDRKSAEPIALHFLGQAQVRGLQQFFNRSKGWFEAAKQQYQTQLAQQLTNPEGFLCIDKSCFVKKGNQSAGVARQYCGQVGKRENCQSDVFLSYASPKGQGLVETKLYLPQLWFEQTYAKKRDECQIPKETTFQTKNEIAAQMIDKLISENQFTVRWVGCDAAFGCDHDFLDRLPDTVYYFAAVRETECIYLSTPTVDMPPNPPGRGRRVKHPRALETPIRIQELTLDESIVWERRVLAQGTKGPIIADIKCVRALSCRKIKQVLVPLAPIWVYIRRYEDGTLKYFISNAPQETDLAVLDRLATMRWSIEQCFQECKNYLGMGHYETRSYPAWHRHMLLVMVAQHFTGVLCESFKKRLFFDVSCGLVFGGGDALCFLVLVG